MRVQPINKNLSKIYKVPALRAKSLEDAVNKMLGFVKELSGEDAKIPTKFIEFPTSGSLSKLTLIYSSSAASGDSTGRVLKLIGNRGSKSVSTHIAVGNKSQIIDMLSKPTINSEIQQHGENLKSMISSTHNPFI